MSTVKPNLSETALRKLLKQRKMLSPLVEKAIEIAKKTHAYQIRDDAQSYLTQHIFPIAALVVEYGILPSRTHEVIPVALLHDVLEPDVTCPYSESQLREDFGDHLANEIVMLHKKQKHSGKRTQQEKHEEHVQYVSQLCKYPHHIQQIKLLDRLNNLQCTEGGKDVEKYARFLHDTETLYYPLALKIDEVLAQRIRIESERIKAELSARV